MAEFYIKTTYDTLKIRFFCRKCLKVIVGRIPAGASKISKCCPCGETYDIGLLSTDGGSKGVIQQLLDENLIKVEPNEHYSVLGCGVLEEIGYFDRIERNVNSLKSQSGVDNSQLLSLLYVSIVSVMDMMCKEYFFKTAKYVGIDTTEYDYKSFQSPSFVKETIGKEFQRVLKIRKSGLQNEIQKIVSKRNIIVHRFGKDKEKSNKVSVSKKELLAAISTCRKYMNAVFQLFSDIYAEKAVERNMEILADHYKTM